MARAKNTVPTKAITSTITLDLWEWIDQKGQWEIFRKRPSQIIAEAVLEFAKAHGYEEPKKA